MASKRNRSRYKGRNGLIALAVVATVAFWGVVYGQYRAWDLERLMGFYEVRKNFPDPAAQHFIAQVIRGRIDAALVAAKEVPGGVNAAGTNGLTALMVAVRRLNLPMVKALLKAGANPNGDVRQVPLHLAIRAKDLTIARTLLEGGANPNGLPGSKPPLMEAALINKFDAVQLLLTAGGKVDAPNAVGRVATMSASTTGHIRMVNYLLDHGGSVWVTSTVGFTMPDFAAEACRNMRDEVQECDRLIARIKAAGYPWPPPSTKEVKKLMDEGKWPPKEAQGR